MPDSQELLRKMAIAIRSHYAAEQEQQKAGFLATAEALRSTSAAFEATRDFLIANELSPAERQAFSEMLDEKLSAAAQRVKDQGFWSTTAGKATVFGVVIAALLSGGELAVTIFNLVH